MALGAFLLFWIDPLSMRKSGSEPDLSEERLNHAEPADVHAPQWMRDRYLNQMNAATGYEVFHSFAFTDQLAASGITFSHKIVDDAGKEYKLVHYDHGNGLSIADVDNDGLYDIYFTTQVGRNMLWRNLGDGKFEDITEKAGVGLGSAIGVASSFADIDNDGDQDLFVTTVRFGNHLFENDGKGRFTDISSQAGLDHTGHSSGAVFFDYDRDGLLDLFVTNVGVYTTDELGDVEGITRFDNLDGEYTYYVGIAKNAFQGHLYPERYEQNILYRNLGNNTFEDVSEEVGLVNANWAGDAIAIDLNEDGWQDLYVLDMKGDDTFYENQQGKGFVEKTSSYFPQTPWGSMGVKALDFNNDLLLDLFVTDMHSDMWETNEFFDEFREMQRPSAVNVPATKYLLTEGTSIFGNAFFKNTGNQRFADIATSINAETYWPWGVSSGDLNADGYEDLFITSSMNYPFRYQVNKAMLNNRGRGFLDAEFVLGIEPRKDYETAKIWYELDCAAEQTAWCVENNLTDQIDVWGALGSRSSVIFDLENDGDLDIVTNEFNAPPLVLVSNLSATPEKPNYISLKLTGTTSNRDALGAIVVLHTASMSQKKVYDGKSGYLSQSSFPLYFGLGQEGQVERIVIHWPSGKVQEVVAPAINSTLELIEP